MKESLEQILSLKTGTAEVSSREHSLYFDEKCQSVVSEWQGFVSKPELIAGSLQSLKLLQQHRCTGLLVDHSRVHGTFADMGDWQQNVWLPTALQLGLKKYAMVASIGSYSALVMELSFEQLGGKIEMIFFTDPQEAKNWLAGF